LVQLLAVVCRHCYGTEEHTYVFDTRSLGEVDCDTDDYLAFTDVRERLSVIKRVTLSFVYETSKNFRNKGTGTMSESKISALEKQP
jgi:hypothetical protein